MDEYEFKVGDRVSLNGRNYIGTIVRITKKRGDIVAQFGDTKYEMTFDKDGREKGGGVWNTSRILPLTPELKQKFYGQDLLKECRNKFDTVVKSGKMTVGMLNDIMKILEKEKIDG